MLEDVESGVNVPSKCLYERIIYVGSKIVFCRKKCPNVEKSLKEGVLPRVLYAEPFPVSYTHLTLPTN